MCSCSIKEVLMSGIKGQILMNTCGNRWPWWTGWWAGEAYLGGGGVGELEASPSPCQIGKFCNFATQNLSKYPVFGCFSWVRGILLNASVYVHFVSYSLTLEEDTASKERKGWILENEEKDNIFSQLVQVAHPLIHAVGTVLCMYANYVSTYNTWLQSDRVDGLTYAKLVFSSTTREKKINT